MKYVDLFCGMGSFHYSFRELGWECIMACDINTHVRETYKCNYHHEPLRFNHSFQLKGSLKEQWKQLGNTIPTIFTKIIGSNIQKYYTLPTTRKVITQ